MGRPLRLLGHFSFGPLFFYFCLGSLAPLLYGFCLGLSCPFFRLFPFFRWCRFRGLFLIGFLRPIDRFTPINECASECFSVCIHIGHRPIQFSPNHPPCVALDQDAALIPRQGTIPGRVTLTILTARPRCLIARPRVIVPYNGLAVLGALVNTAARISATAKAH